MKIGAITTDPTKIKKRTLLPTYIYKFHNETKTDKSLRYSIHIKYNYPICLKKQNETKQKKLLVSKEQRSIYSPHPEEFPKPCPHRDSPTASILEPFLG